MDEEFPVRFFKQMRRTGGKRIIHVIARTDDAPHIDIDCWCDPEADDWDGKADGVLIFHKQVTWQ